jgi:hypothetical protein
MMKQFLESADLLQTVAIESEKLNDDARHLVAGLTEAQLNWKSAPEKWSIAQCLDHLAVTLEKDDQYFRGAIARGREKRRVNGAVAYRPTIFGGWLIKQLLPEATRKMRAPRAFRPAESSAIEGALDRFLRQQENFLNFVSDAREIDYNKTRLRSAVTPLFRYSLADAFVMIVVHGQRHLAQARRVRETAEFPRS